MKGNFLANTNEPHANESSLDYLRRKCQRYSELDAENDMLIRNSIKNSGKPPSKKKKKKKKGKGKQQNGKSGNADRLEEDKWGKGTEEEITIDNSKEEVHEESHLCFDIGIDSDGVDDILNYYMNEAGISFDPESKRELEQMEDRNKRVKVKRELGDWITCTVKDGKITCNCERYVYWRDCKHVVWMEVELLIWWRDKTKRIARLIQCLIMGVIVGTVSWQTEDPQTRMGVNFQSIFFISLGAMLKVPVSSRLVSRIQFDYANAISF
jgi:hypothetical protein